MRTKKDAHQHCPHTFSLCATCDVVYCKDCKREWGGHAHSLWQWSSTNVAPVAAGQYGTYTMTPVAKSHSHN